MSAARALMSYPDFVDTESGLAQAPHHETLRLDDADVAWSAYFFSPPILLP